MMNSPLKHLLPDATSHFDFNALVTAEGKLRCPSHTTSFNEEDFLRLLSHSSSLTVEEKIRLLCSLPSFSQQVIDQLMVVLYREEQKLAILYKKELSQLVHLQEQKKEELVVEITKKKKV